LKTHKKLTSIERERLSVWKKEGLSNKECARRLGRHVSSIGRELKRNRIRVVTNHGKDWEDIYEPFHAQSVAESRKKNAWFAKQPLKDKKIFRYVMRKLRNGWSPEQIAGRLKRVDHPNDKSWHICMETIYQFIYKEKTDKTKQGLLTDRILNKRLPKVTTVATITDNNRPLYEYLRRKQIKRRKLKGRKVQRVRIPDRVSIHDRPKEINKRKKFGHWEGDSIVGRNHKNGLHTEYERVSSLIAAAYMPKVDTQSFVNAADEIYSPLPEYAKLSSTLDNGSEHIAHKKVTKKHGILFYFADPYSAWQRGGNENGNMWIRYYFPKGTDFSTISREEIQDVVWEINNRPRKRLGFKTPQEVFNEYLKILP
jgi:transposase, IS30 family